MSKGQKRSNREAKKPKQPAAATTPKSESSFDSQMKSSKNAPGTQGKTKT